MQLWLMTLPKEIKVQEETGKNCSVSYDNGTIKIDTKNEASGTYYLTIIV